MTVPLIYVESCPVCGDGLCRIRVCITDQRLTGCVLCDECEAVWTDPSLQERVSRKPNADDPECPSCGLSLWSKNAHWANVGEVCLLGWYDRVRVVSAKEG